MKKTLARALALATIVTGASIAVPTSAAASTPTYDVPDSIPTQCTARMQTVDHSGNYGQVFMSEGRISHTVDGGRFPFVPQSLIPYGSIGAEDSHGFFGGLQYVLAIAPDGRAHDIIFQHETDNQGGHWVSLLDDTVIGHGWQTTEDLTLHREFAYRLTTDGYLVRYTWGGGGLTDKTQVFSGGTSIRTIAHDRRISWNGGQADVLLTVTTGGKLREYIVPVDDPTAWSARNLKDSTWGTYSQLSTDPCGTTGRVIMGRHDNGQVAVWYDRNRNDFSGADIRGNFTDLPALPSSTKTHQ
ncbi:MAG: hypothetical protein QJR09_03280 [Micrococcus sp.]|nr:hypothetical protein [Micrococcus sp.]